MAKKKAEPAWLLSPPSRETLSRLFDYQRFENDPLLEAWIDETASRYGGEISDDDLSHVSAAGEAAPVKKHTAPKNNAG